MAELQDLTDEQIDTMPAGQELDDLVALSIGYEDYPQDIPCYSDDISDAWKVVEKIGLCVDYQTNTAIVSKNGIELAKAFNDAPLAICRAGLKAARQ